MEKFMPFGSADFKLLDLCERDPKMSTIVVFLIRRKQFNTFNYKTKNGCIELQPDELIFTYEDVCKWTGLTLKEVRHRIAILKQHNLLKEMPVYVDMFGNMTTIQKNHFKPKKARNFTAYFVGNSVREKNQKDTHQGTHFSERKVIEKGTRSGTIPYIYSGKESNRNNAIYKKESEERKKPVDPIPKKPLASRSLSFNSEDVEAVKIFGESRGVFLRREDIARWLRIYDSDRIIKNIDLLSRRSCVRSPSAWLENALKTDFAMEPTRIAENRSYALQYQQTMKWNDLVVTQQYCRSSVAHNDLSFKLPPPVFANALGNMHEKVRDYL
jgi:hypothetical protein